MPSFRPGSPVSRARASRAGRPTGVNSNPVAPRAWVVRRGGWIGRDGHRRGRSGGPRWQPPRAAGWAAVSVSCSRGEGCSIEDGRSSCRWGPAGADGGRCPQFPQGLLQDIPEKYIPGAPTFPYSRKGKVGVALPKVPTSATQSTHPGPRSRPRRYPKYPPGNVGIPTKNGCAPLKYPPFRTVFPAATQSTHPGWAAAPFPGAGYPQAGAGLLARGRGACDTDRVTDVGPRTKT